MGVDLRVMAPPLRAFPLRVVGPPWGKLSDSTFVGVLPASPDPLASFQGADTHGEFASSQILAHPKFLSPGDTIATPSSLPIHTVFSLGDLVLMLGVAVLVHTACGSKLVPRRLRRA